LNDKLKQTIRIQRGDKVKKKPVDTIELELVSTGMLQKILDSDDDEQKERIKSLADKGEGVLAKTPGADEFEIISDEELATALEASGQETEFEQLAESKLEPIGSTADVEVLSLVSTQALRRILRHEDNESASEPDEIDLDIDQGGYNPYNSG